MLKKVILFIIKINKRISRPLVQSEFNIDSYFNDRIVNLSKSSKKIIEVGGVSRPILRLSDNYKYFGIDIDNNFNSEEFYDEFFCQSIELELPVNGDLIFSKYLMEHVENVKISYLNQEKSLLKGGKSIHLYPLGYHPFSILNKIFSNNFTKKLIGYIRPESAGITGYPAFYSLGNYYNLEKFLKSKRIKAKFKYHYGAVDYFSFFFPFALIIFMFNMFCKTFNLKIFASNVVVEISKN